MGNRSSDQVVEEAEKLYEDIMEAMNKPSKFSQMFANEELYPYNQAYADCDDQYILYRAGRKVGKTITTAIKTLHFACFPYMKHPLVKNYCEILIVAPTQNQAGIMFDTIKRYAHVSKDIERMIVRETLSVMEIAWPTGDGVTKIHTKAAGERGDSVRGYAPHLIIVDEAAFVRDDVFKALMPAGLATQARVWLTSTPFGKHGWFWNCHLDSRPMVANGTYREFHAKSTDNPLIAKNRSYVEQMRRLTKDEQIQELEGEFIEEGDALFPHQLIMDAIHDFKMDGKSLHYYLGVDVARSGKDETVYCVIANDANGNVYLVETEDEAQSNLVNVAGRCREYFQKYPIEVIFMDETGVGGGCVDLCRELALPVRGVFFTMKEKERMYRTLRLLFENHRFHMNRVDKMVYQLSYMKKQFYANGIMKIFSEEHEDYCDSLALACSAVTGMDTWHVIEGDNKDIFG